MRAIHARCFEEVKTVWLLFQRGQICVGLVLKESAGGVSLGVDFDTSECRMTCMGGMGYDFEQ